MIKIDLITGFLGSGKTTFIRNYAKYLISQGHHVGIIENDFGAINIDMLLLKDLENDQCELEPIVGGNDDTDWKRRFKAKLILFALEGIDRVIVEPSGIYDVNTFKEILYDESVCNKYQIGNILTIVEAKMDKQLSRQVEYLFISQLANCGKVLLSKTDHLSESQIQCTIDHLSELLVKYDCDRNLKNCIFTKNWAFMTDDDYQMLMNSGFEDASYKSILIDKEKSFTSLFFMNKKMPRDGIDSFLNQMMNDVACGKIFRIKGFFLDNDGKWMEVNATKDHHEIKTTSVGQEVVIVIGEELNRDVIEAYFDN